MEDFSLLLLWSNLFGFRLLVTLMPQYGFVTKEEFNYPDQVAGIVGLEQEAATTLQEKQSLIPYLTSGIPFKILKAISQHELMERIISPYSVLIAPRLWMTICSMVIDLTIFKISCNVGCNEKSGLIAMTLFSGSYISWVYLTRTLPVGVNTILYVFLLYAITRNLSVQSEANSSFLCKNNWTSLIVGFCLYLGVHADACFLDFSAFPVLLWLFHPQFSMKTLSRKLVSIFITVLSIVIAINANNTVLGGANGNNFNIHNFSSYCDLFRYMNDISPHFDSFHNITSKIAYTTSLPLTMFGPLMIPLLRVPSSILSSDESAHGKSSQSVLISSIVSALFAFILFKERDFNSILPLIIPVVILVAKYQGLSKKLLICYGLFNSFAFTYHGTYKYSGAIHSMSFLGSMVEPMKHYGVYDIVFYETPILPKYLLAMQCDYDSAIKECSIPDYLNLRFISSDSKTVLELLDTLLYKKPDYSVLLVIPGSVPCNLITHINSMFTLQLFYRCFPHVISLDSVPDYSNPEEWCRIRGGYFDNILDLTYEKFSLNIYAVGRKKTIKTGHIENAEKLTVVINKYSSVM